MSKFVDWMTFHKREPIAIDFVECLETLNDEVLNKKQMTHIDFSKEIPEKFTEDAYFKTFQMIWDVIRYEIWKKIDSFKNSGVYVGDQKF